MTDHRAKPFISEDHVEGVLDGPKLVVPYYQNPQQGEYTTGDALDTLKDFPDYELRSHHVRLGHVCDPKTKSVYGHHHAADNLVRCAVVEVGKK